MSKTILVPLDGSPVAEQGLITARRLAKATGATLSLVRGVPYFYLAMSRKEQEANRAAVRAASEYLRTVQHQLTEEGFTVHTQVVPLDPVGAILFIVDLQDVDLISICTHGRSGLRHSFVGSVADAVLRQADVPILMTRAMAESAQQASAPYRRILVPLDGTPFAEAALSYLTHQRIGDDADLVLLHVVAPVTLPYDPGLTGEAAVQLFNEANRETKQQLLDAETYLQATGTALRKKGAWHARTTLGDAGPEILAVATAEDVDLIVLVSHARHGLERLMYGSVARELLHHAELPVLILQGDVVRANLPAAQDLAGPTT